MKDSRNETLDTHPEKTTRLAVTHWLALTGTLFLDTIFPTSCFRKEGNDIAICPHLNQIKSDLEGNDIQVFRNPLTPNAILISGDKNLSIFTRFYRTI